MLQEKPAALPQTINNNKNLETNFENRTECSLPQIANQHQIPSTNFEKRTECSLAQTSNNNLNLGTVTYRWQAQPKR